MAVKYVKNIICGGSVLLMASCTETPVSKENAFVENLLSQMTIDEKLGQMNQVAWGDWCDMAKKGQIGSVLNITNINDIREMQRCAVEESRLGIPVLVARDVIHGYKTIFPIPLGQAATFNPEIVEKGARVSAIEASSEGIRWTFSPMVDISRDPRWGRIAESFGEDQYLSSVLGSAMVRGYQGDDLTDPTSIAACVKHFVGYGAAEGGRDYNSTYITENSLRNVYLKPFQSAAQEGALTYMTSFNDNDGVPCSANKKILKDILRKEWGFDGVVVSDWASIGEMVPHGFAHDNKEAGMQAINAGVDMEMVSGSYVAYGKELLAEKKIDIKSIDEAVRNILRVKYRLGLFENPYFENNPEILYAPEHLDAAKQAAIEGTILLKNERNVLPLDRNKVKTLAIIGPLADAPYEQMGTWVFDGEKERSVTPLTAISQMLNVSADKMDGQYKFNVVNNYSNSNKVSGTTNVIFEPGLAYSRDKNKSGIPAAVSAARRADAVVVFVGEESILSGEAHSLADISLQGAQKELIDALATTGKDIIMVVMAGRPLTIGDQIDKSAAVLYSFHPGTMGGPALAEIIFGEAVPSGKTPVTFPKMVGQIPLYYNHNMTGRPASRTETLLNEIPVEAGQTSLGCTSFYLDAGFDPLFPFGYGLSYTTFDITAPKIDSKEYKAKDIITASCVITNTGSVEATEVVQLYTRDLVGSITRPVKELKSFERVTLKPGESKEVVFCLPVEDLAFWNSDMQYGVESGEYLLWINNSSLDSPSVNFFVK